MALTEILLSILVLLVAWMRVATATRESAYEFEQRLRNRYRIDSEGTHAFRNDETDEISIGVENVTFQEWNNLLYLLKRTFHPWQDIRGVVVFDIRTDGFVIEDADEFADTMADNLEILPCSHNHHDNHYYIKIDGEPSPDSFSRMLAYDTTLYYIPNSEIAVRNYNTS